MVPTTPLHVLYAALAAFVIGFLLHSPPLGRYWMKLSDLKPAPGAKMSFSGMLPQMILNLIANFATAWVLAMMYSFAATSTLLSGPSVRTGLSVAFWLWLGFLVASSSADVIWMGKKKSLWLYEAFSSLLVMLAMGAIIAW